jgi:thiosulfate dehydrogenase [quinone] large subunit
MRWLDWGPKIPMEYLALIRIMLGLAFLSNGLQKVLTGYLGSGAALTTYVEGQLRGPFTDPLYRSFLQGVLLPNADAFAPLLVVAELLVGLGLVLGLGTRLAAVGAVFLSLNYWLAAGPLSTPAQLRSFLIIGIVVLLAVPGVAWGLDGRLLGRAPGWLIGRPDRLPLERLHAVGPIRWLRPSGYATQLNYVALLRMGLGFCFLVAGTIKLVFDNVPNDPRFVFNSFEVARNQGYRDPLAQAWLDMVAANYGLFGWLITAGELTAGTLLFLGLFTRFGAALGIWMNLNYQWMKGWGNNAGFNDRGWIVCELVILLVGAGLVVGLDGILKSYLPRWLTGAEESEVEPAAAPAGAPERLVRT